MPDHCVDLQRIDSVAPGSPEWDHVQGCARCWSLWKDHQAFLAADPSGLDPADLADADQRISRLPSQPRRVPLPTRWLAIAAAVVAMASFGVWQLVPHERPQSLRGEGLSAGWAIEVTLDADAIAVTWAPVPDADGYRVVFFDTALVELQQHETAGPSLVVPRELAPEARFLRVQALRIGDVVDQSELRAVE